MTIADFGTLPTYAPSHAARMAPHELMRLVRQQKRFFDDDEICMATHFADWYDEKYENLPAFSPASFSMLVEAVLRGF